MKTNRRKFIETGFMLAAIGGLTGVSALAGCSSHEEEGEGKEVSPPEDLMQEHGLLNRILLIYDTARNNLLTRTPFPVEALAGAAGIIRTFVEDYHERQEEQYLFPRFQKANQLTDLVQVLLQQH